MKYYIVRDKEKLILYKVSNELVEKFEKKYTNDVIVSGGSIMEILLEFERLDQSRKNGDIEGIQVKYELDS